MLPAPEPGEPEITDDQVRRWIKAARGWGYPVGQEALTFPDNATVALTLKGSTMICGRHYASDIVADALELTLVDVELARGKGVTEESKTGLGAVKRFFEKTITDRLRLLKKAKLERDADEAIICAKSEAEIKANGAIHERRVGAFDAVVAKNASSRGRSSDTQPQTIEEFNRQLDKI
jgi:hypothetical protein